MSDLKIIQLYDNPKNKNLSKKNLYKEILSSSKKVKDIIKSKRFDYLNNVVRNKKVVRFEEDDNKPRGIIKRQNKSVQEEETSERCELEEETSERCELEEETRERCELEAETRERCELEELLEKQKELEEIQLQIKNDIISKREAEINKVQKRLQKESIEKKKHIELINNKEEIIKKNNSKNNSLKNTTAILKYFNAPSRETSIYKRTQSLKK